MTDDINKKIMIVDDDKFLLDMYAMKFKNSGYEVTACANSEECLNKLREGLSPDALVFDLLMSKMDGYTLYKNIVEEKLIPDSIKIILTNQGQESDRGEADEFKIDGYIVKALHTPSQVVKKVGEILENKDK